MPHLWVYFLCLLGLPTVDSLLDPDNRLHLTTEEQLKALLDKLDVVASMRTSGGRTKRIRLLRREINSLRQKMNQPQQNSQSVHGNDKEEDVKEEEQEEKKEKKKKTNVKNGPLTAVSNSASGKNDFHVVYASVNAFFKCIYRAATS